MRSPRLAPASSAHRTVQCAPDLARGGAPSGGDRASFQRRPLRNCRPSRQACRRERVPSARSGRASRPARDARFRAPRRGRLGGTSSARPQHVSAEFLVLCPCIRRTRHWGRKFGAGGRGGRLHGRWQLAVREAWSTKGTVRLQCVAAASASPRVEREHDNLLRCKAVRTGGEVLAGAGGKCLAGQYPRVFHDARGTVFLSFQKQCMRVPREGRLTVRKLLSVSHTVSIDGFLVDTQYGRIKRGGRMPVEMRRIA